MHALNGCLTDPVCALSVFADFTLPGASWPALAAALAGSLGVLAAFLARRAASRAVPVKVPKR